MEIKIIHATSLFEKQYKKLSRQLKERTKEKEKIFRSNPFHQSLKTHKLSGKEKEAWAFSLDYKYRIKFIFITTSERAKWKCHHFHLGRAKSEQRLNTSRLGAGAGEL